MKKIFIMFVALICLTLILLPASFIQAQTIRKNNFIPYWQIKLNTGTSLFFGDVKQTSFWPVSSNNNEWRMGTGLILSRQLSRVVGIDGQALYGQLSGTRRDINQYFETDYIEFTLNATASLTNLIWRYNPSRRYNVYLLAGIGFTNYNTNVYDLNSETLIARVGDGYGSSFGGRTLEGIISGGIGLSYQLNERWNVIFETTNHFMNADNMDNLVKGSNDFYNYTSLGIGFKLGRGKNSRFGQMVETTSPRGNSGERRPNTAQQEKVNVEKPIAVEMQPVQPPVNIQNQEVKKPEPIPATQVSPVEKKKSMLPVRPILEYRVQIRARYGRAMSTTYLTTKYHITHFTIREDMHNGYYIYTIGSFDTYEQARSARDTIRHSNGIHDAFVVAFKNGYRLDKLPK